MRDPVLSVCGPACVGPADTWWLGPVVVGEGGETDGCDDRCCTELT